MPNTYSQLYIHLVFAVKYREALIGEAFEMQLYRYIKSIILRKKQFCLAINGMPDHIHVAVSVRPNQRVSELVREIKAHSSSFLSREMHPQFEWQTGYGAFSFSHSHKERVIQYIQHQKAHHRKKGFQDEYLELLDKYEIPYEDKYLFDWII